MASPPVQDASSQDADIANHQPLVSVIIPVFNDAQRLRTCLAALMNQTYPPSRYEIIVVDNGSEPSQQAAAVVAAVTAEQVSKLAVGTGLVRDIRVSKASPAAELSPSILTAYESVPGSYAARNRGLSLARGEVIAFTDADCIPAPDWLAEGVQVLTRNPNCGLVAGAVQLFFRNPKRPTMVELYESVTALQKREFVERHHYGATANVFTTRQVIEQVGGFDAELKARGDVEWGQRVYAHGYQQIYAESVVVHHPARASLRELYIRTCRLAGGVYDLQRQQTKSVWQRQLVFGRSLGQDLVPPVFFVINTFLDPGLKGVGQKLKVSWVMVMVRCISAWEKVRLKLGGTSSRL